MTSPGSRIAAAFAAFTLALFLPVGPAAALAPFDTSDFSFESFSAQYHLDVDDSGRTETRVVETLVARFPEFDQNRGIIRAIPMKDGDVPLDITMVSVTDENGDPVYFERNDYDGFAEFALGTDEFVHGRTTYVLEYTMRDTIRHFEDSGPPGTGIDEFYWDVNGNGWGQSFDTVSADVFLSPELASALTGDSACYLGYYGDSGQCEITRNADGTEFRATVGPVSEHNTLTLAIGFDGGTVVQPPLPRDSWVVQLLPKLLLALAALLVIIAIIVKNGVWRDAPGRGTIIAEYTPPKESNLLLDANLIKRVGSGLPALFVDFAVRGMIKVIDSQPGAAVTSDKSRFSLQFVTSHGANAQELKVLVALFGVSLTPGKRVNPGLLSADIGASLYGLPASTAILASKEGYRAEPVSTLPKLLGRIAFWAVLAFFPIWVWAAIFDVLDDNVIGPAFGTLALAIAVPIILIKPKRLTSKGAQARDYLLGMREYLTIAEEDRMRVLQSAQGAERVDVTDRDAVVKLNERLLPYAVLWGVEGSWVEQLRAYYRDQTPSWLEGNSFDSSLFRSFTYASTSSVRPIVTSSSSGGSSWSSSGGSSFSSGSSGGGFSGGGGGGGGGGGR
ncbi:MAG: hypothetical protein JWP85_842 [Rhodoglobus sp.]|nr:hypothetical protein [Rhodoglobus sp.]